MMMIGYALEHPSGTYEMYNPKTDSIVITNSIKWTDFNRWELKSSEKQIRGLYDTETSQNDPKYVYFDSSYEIPSKQLVDYLKANSSAKQSPAKTPSIIKTRSHGTPSPPTVDTSNPKVLRALKQLSTSSIHKVTGDTTPHRIFDEDMNLSYIHHIYTDEVGFS